MLVFVLLMKKCLDSISEYLKNHWVTNTIITSIPSIFFLLVQTAGRQFHLVDENGNLYKIALIIFITCIVIDILFTGYKFYRENNETNKYKDGQTILSNTLSSLDTIDDSICSQLEKFITTSKKNEYFREPFSYTTKPEQTIRYIFKELIVCLSNLTDLKREQIGVSIIYKFDFEDDWQTPISENVSGTSIKEILKNPNSTASKLINEKRDIICFANKNKAFINGCYIASSKDDDKKSGSIICANAMISNGENTYITGVLSITTYGKQLFRENDEYTKESVTDAILPPFRKVIRKELCCAYINKSRYLQKEKKDKKTLQKKVASQ